MNHYREVKQNREHNGYFEILRRQTTLINDVFV